MLDERYFSLRAHLYEREEAQTIAFKLQELEAIWYCSQKNAKRILKELEANGKLTYIPGKGRGKRSTLLFPKPFQKEVEDFVTACVERDELDEAAHLLRLPIPKSWIAKASYDIRKMFSYREQSSPKDVLHAFIARSLTTLDPLEVSITFEAHMIEQLGDPLLKYDAEKDEVRPHIAHHVEVDDSSRTWTFHLRKGVRFHNDEELTSEDVQSTLWRAMNTEASTSWLTEGIRSIDCPSRYKVIIHLDKPNPFFPRYMAASNLCILPSGIPFDEQEWIGTGPFYLKERTENKLVLAAFDGYFKERPLLDEVQFFKVSQEAASIINFTVADGDDVNPAQKHEIETGFRFLTFNFHKKNIVQDPYFREAVYHLLDIERVADSFGWRAFGDAPESPSDHQYVEASSFVPKRSTHLEKKSAWIPELLKKSGYAGEPLKLFHLEFPSAVKEAEWLEERGAEYGIHFERHPFNFSNFYTEDMGRDVDLIFMGEVSSLDPHLSFLGAFYNKNLFFRRFFPEWGLQWIHDKLEDFKRQESYEGRERVMDEIETYIREQHLLIFQYHPVKVRTFHPMIQDVRFQSFGHFDFSKIWIPR
ncbi:ABC transporter substrate-binding protein [Halobacillus sp. Nhm2S1]|uniref:ABC transporter substrate-binding protein n=1 Tax=Halobacillus sp. Nhm2S1 TaxID=2866716 RepID=UPI001C736A9F|nr:ABC transporter substrate-binding protein [Halobacillus sp. Nhm2S1]MBX0358387.1 SgrR family transcriptional regulator [Halobacillus sp. Nhm2S1]